MVLTVTTYKTLDGEIFEDAKKAEEHEKSLAEYKNLQRHRFEKSYSGSRLLDQYPIDKYGTWMIYGEDSNPDYGGSHHQPYLGTVEGTLDQAIEWAVNHDRFWQWGSGGRIELIEVIKL